MITFASLLGLMMVGSSVDFGDAMDRLTGSNDDDTPEDDGDAFNEEVRAFGFGLEQLLDGAVPTDAFSEFGDEMQSYYEDEAALDALADGALGETADPVGATLDDWLAMTDGAPTLIDEYDETEDALFVVYDAQAHPDPVLSVGPSDTGEDDAMLLLDGMPLAVVSGGAGLDLDMVSLVPEAQFPMALAAGA
ncbi:hypothetical protein [Rhodovulum marinum]|uniref:Uncharacterized protein n=1 Tax=Rhodovulum marinum TaxID=320662 RepID=A0A4V6NQZ2_9RHOB|nr:hypothetical protein [Rhodovulum marinum]TCP39766.1 hypothetical protein EV662_11071 [Rhodovulum marinum]